MNPSLIQFKQYHLTQWMVGFFTQVLQWLEGRKLTDFHFKYKLSASMTKRAGMSAKFSIAASTFYSLSTTHSTLLCKSAIHPNLEQGFFLLFTLKFQCASIFNSIPKRAVKFMKRLRLIAYDPSFHQLWLFSSARRWIRKNLTATYKHVCTK